jgi:hypothetical protein
MHVVTTLSLSACKAIGVVNWNHSLSGAISKKTEIIGNSKNAKRTAPETATKTFPI